MHKMLYPLAGSPNQQTVMFYGKIVIGSSGAVTSHDIPNCTVAKDSTGVYSVVFQEKVATEPLVFVTIQTNAGIDLIPQVAYLTTAGFLIVTLTHATPSQPDSGTEINVLIITKNTTLTP